MSKDDTVEEEEEQEEEVEELLVEEPKPEEEEVEELLVEEPKPVNKRKAVRRRKKVEPKKGDGELEPFDLKSYFIPKDRNWVLPAFVAIVVLLFGYYMVVFMGVVDETCKDQADIGDEDCDGYVDNPETSTDDSNSDGSDSGNNTTSGDLNNNSTDGG
jgi:hypothetical protein